MRQISVTDIAFPHESEIHPTLRNSVTKAPMTKIARRPDTHAQPETKLAKNALTPSPDTEQTHHNR